MQPKPALIIMLKNPVLGKVKTRLAADIGNERALKIYQELLQHTLTVSRNIQADKFILAVVLVEDENIDGPHYIHKPFSQEPDWGTTSVNYDIKELLSKAKGFL